MMDYRQVKMFQAVMEHGSVTEAARCLGVTQPAVSGALAKLERSVGFLLFRREGRRVVPTEEAKLLHREASQVMTGFTRLAETAAGISAAQRGSLTVATNPGPAISWLPGVVAAFCRARPDVRIRLLTRSSSEVRDLAALSAFDLGLAETPFTHGETVLRRYNFARVVALRADDPLARHELLTPQLMDGTRLVATVASNWSWSVIARTFEAAGATYHVAAECEFTAIALNMVAAGAGVSFADPISAADVACRGLVARPFLPVIPYEVGLLAPAHGMLMRVAEAFTDALDAHLRPFLLDPSSSQPRTKP